jgi:hypothetical protein
VAADKALIVLEDRPDADYIELFDRCVARGTSGGKLSRRRYTRDEAAHDGT